MIEETTIPLENIWEQFPIFRQEKLHYLDSGASAQKPDAVIDGMHYYWQSCYANVHRGTYRLSEEITRVYEKARTTMAAFLGANSEEIIWQTNATAGINLVAYSYGRHLLQADQTIVLSAMEHHANIVPWQILSKERGNPIEVVHVQEDGSLDMEHYAQILSHHKVGLVALSQMSNVLGTINDAKKIASLAHQHGAKVLIDGSQGAVHMPVNVKDIDCDFYVCTGHKLYGPTGIGVLYGKAELLAQMPPVYGGGDMIDMVSFSGTTFAEAPAKFEPGTPPIVEAIGLAYAVEWLNSLGWQNIMTRENMLANMLAKGLAQIKEVRVYGEAAKKGGIFSFNLEGAHHHDVSMMLNDMVNVSVRSGHHCAQPLMHHLGVKGMVRATIGVYNRAEDIEKLLEGLERIVNIHRKRKQVS